MTRAGISHHVTVHGMRYTFTDLTRLAKVDPVVRRELVGHVTQHMQHHYSTVALDEKRAAAHGVVEIAPLPALTPTLSERNARRSGTAQPTGKGRPRSGERSGDENAADGGQSRQ